MGSGETGSRAVTRQNGLQPAALVLRVLKTTQSAKCVPSSNFQENKVKEEFTPVWIQQSEAQSQRNWKCSEPWESTLQV